MDVWCPGQSKGWREWRAMQNVLNGASQLQHGQPVCLCSCYSLECRFPSLSATRVSLKIQLLPLQCWVQGLGLRSSVHSPKNLLFQSLG